MFTTINRIGSAIQEACTIPENAVVQYNKVKRVEHRRDFRKVVAIAAKEECKLLAEVKDLKIPEDAVASWLELEKLYA